MDEPQLLKFNYDRRFGVEIELNSFDRRDFKNEPLEKGELPAGIYYVANLLVENLQSAVKVNRHHHTHNNFGEWVCKPDSSCGMEICSPATKGWTGLRNMTRAIEVFGEDKKIQVDNRCSFHVHVNIDDCIAKIGTGVGCSNWNLDKSNDAIAILAWWIKCEPVFLDSVPKQRKRSRYCMCIGQSDVFNSGERPGPDVIARLGFHKYFSCNSFHLNAKARPTIEFRPAGYDFCTDSFCAKNWVRLLIHFVEMAKLAGRPQDYRWLDPMGVFDLLGFLETHRLSPELVETRNWFLARIISNMLYDELPGVWSKIGRNVARQQAVEIVELLHLDRENIGKYLQENKSLIAV